MIKFCIDLRDKGITFENSGSKAYALHTIRDTVSIPNGFVITTKVFDAFIKNNKLEQVINKVIPEFSG